MPLPFSILPSVAGDIQSSVRYDLALDPGRLISRAVFDETKNWTLTRRKTLGLGDHCETMRLLLPVRLWSLGKGRGIKVADPCCLLWEVGRVRVERGWLGGGTCPKLSCGAVCM